MPPITVVFVSMPIARGTAFGALDQRQRRRLLLGTLLRGALTTLVLLAAYYILPYEDLKDAGAILLFVVGIAAVLAVIAWQIRAIFVADYPRLRLVEAISMIIPLLIIVFAAVYVVMSHNSPGTFSTHLDRTQSLYFTITTLATVGYGDIVPTTDGARLLVSAQMLLDLALIGIVARALFSAAQAGEEQKQQQGQDGDAAPEGA
jgi:UDP-N-acetylmuramyl pentapeptide phosphotransferase/UDP-N-acetylglucosamine-1-phosphate transferase